MILTHEAIMRAHEEGSIVIEPFNPELVSINSVDVRLGHQLWKLKKQKIRDVYNPSEDDWEQVAPISVGVLRETYPTFAQDVLQDDDQAFIFESGEFYLATTLEKIGTRATNKKMKILKAELPFPTIVSEMKAKSTVGRQGLTVALCAGLGDVGYVSRWALEVRVTDDGDVPLAIGTPIAQVVFTQAIATEEVYDGESRYQHGEETRFLPKPLKFIRSDNG